MYFKLKVKKNNGQLTLFNAQLIPYLTAKSEQM